MWRGGLESLERRTLFAATGQSAALEMLTVAPAPPAPPAPPAQFVPVLPPRVLAAQFDDERAPHEIRITFDRDVHASLDGRDLVLINDRNRSVFPSEIITVNWDAQTHTAHFVFARAEGGTLEEGTWHATLLAEGITDDLGVALEEDYHFSFGFLRADVNRDGAVDLSDFNILAANFGQTERTFSQGDVNYDGVVNLADFRIIASSMGARNPMIPIGVPAPPMKTLSWKLQPELEQPTPPPT